MARWDSRVRRELEGEERLVVVARGFVRSTHVERARPISISILARVLRPTSAT